MADKIELTEREREILECMVSAWDKNGACLYGGYSYGEAFELLARFGFEPPPTISNFIEWSKEQSEVMASTRKKLKN